MSSLRAKPEDGAGTGSGAEKGGGGGALGGDGGSGGEWGANVEGGETVEAEGVEVFSGGKTGESLLAGELEGNESSIKIKDR